MMFSESYQPVTAWTKNDDERSIENANKPGANRRLFEHKFHSIPGLTLGVHPSSKYYINMTECSQIHCRKAFSRTSFERRKDKLVPLLRPPYFLLSVILIVVSIHFWRSNNVLTILEWSSKTWWKQPWKLFTYGFIHTSVSHVALNALVALTVGWILEREQGWRRMLFLWLGGLAAGALGSGALQPKAHILGASAAVYTLITAHIPNVCLRYGHIPLWWFRPLSVLVLSTSEICWRLMQNDHPTERHVAAQAHFSYEHVAWAAHVFGAAVGIPLAFIVFTGENYKKPIVVACRVVSALLLVAGILVAVVYYTKDCS